MDVTNATWVDPVALVALPEVANGADNQLGTPNNPNNPTAEELALMADNMPSTGRDMMVYPYVLTITPKYANKDDIVVKVKAFEDMVLPDSNMYIPGTKGSGLYRRYVQTHHQGWQRGSESRNCRI